MPKTVTRNVQVLTEDLERMNDLYRITGTHGVLTKLIQRGLHMELFLEEISRGRITANQTLLQAIHTVRTALDQRDCGTYDQSTSETCVSP